MKEDPSLFWNEHGRKRPEKSIIKLQLRPVKIWKNKNGAKNDENK
jgi:hypothetical protein